MNVHVMAAGQTGEKKIFGAECERQDIERPYTLRGPAEYEASTQGNRLD